MHAHGESDLSMLFIELEEGVSLLSIHLTGSPGHHCKIESKQSSVVLCVRSKAKKLLLDIQFLTALSTGDSSMTAADNTLLA